jgi:hypothetical protein
VFAVTTSLLHPFVGLVQIASSAAADGSTRVSVVSTGLLPVRVGTAAGHGHSTPVDLAAGHLGVLTLSDPPADGRYQLATHLHLSTTGWAAIALVWSLPLLWVLASGLFGGRREAGARHAA